MNRVIAINVKLSQLITQKSTLFQKLVTSPINMDPKCWFREKISLIQYWKVGLKFYGDGPGKRAERSLFV